MSETVCFTLPLPPTVNLWWKPVVRAGFAKLVLTDDANKYKAEAYILLLSQRNRMGTKPFDGPVSVDVRIYEDRAGRDHDNYGKGLYDVLKGFAYHDDKQIRKACVELFAPPAGQTKAAKSARDKWRARVEVTVKPLELEGE